MFGRKKKVKEELKDAMTEQEAIKYLQQKDELTSEKYIRMDIECLEEEREKADEKKIAKVRKKGKIYGDPCVELG